MEKFNVLHQMIGEAIDAKEIPGMVLGIIDGDVEYVQDFGETYPLYDIASVTKLFITTRILQLVEDGKLDLDSEIQEILPQFKNEDITIDHCLLHRTGFAPSLSGRYTMNKDELMNSLYECIDLVNPVDSVAIYSCINYILLGEVIVTIDGSIEKGLHEGIFQPLHLNDTKFLPENKQECAPTGIDQNKLPIQGIVNDSTSRVLGGVSGNAGLFSSIDDLMKFARSYLDQSILTHEMINQVMDTNVESRSLGWNIYKDQYIYHTGFTGPSLLLDIENRKALILMTNRNYPQENDAYLKRRLELFDCFLTQ